MVISIGRDHYGVDCEDWMEGERRSNGAIERWSDGAMEQWSDGAMEQRNDGAKERWSKGTMAVNEKNIAGKL